MRKIKLLTTLPLVACGLVMASCGKGPSYTVDETVQAIVDNYDDYLRDAGATEEQVEEYGWSISEYDEETGELVTRGTFQWDGEEWWAAMYGSNTMDGYKEMLDYVSNIKGFKTVDDWQAVTLQGGTEGEAKTKVCGDVTIDLLVYPYTGSYNVFQIEVYGPAPEAE